MGREPVRIVDGWTGRIVRARSRRQAALEAFKAEIGPILDAASDRLRIATSLQNVEDYRESLGPYDLGFASLGLVVVHLREEYFEVPLKVGELAEILEVSAHGEDPAA